MSDLIVELLITPRRTPFHAKAPHSPTPPPTLLIHQVLAAQTPFLRPVHTTGQAPDTPPPHPGSLLALPQHAGVSTCLAFSFPSMILLKAPALEISLAKTSREVCAFFG